MSATRRPAGMLDTAITTRDTSSRSRGLSVGDASRSDLIDVYGLDRQVADALCDRLGVALTLRRCEAAARTWRLKIRHVSGRDTTGISELASLRWIYEIECHRLRAAPRPMRLVEAEA